MTIIASVISLVSIGLPVSATALAGASRALVFLGLSGFVALAPPIAYVGKRRVPPVRLATSAIKREQAPTLGPGGRSGLWLAAQARANFPRSVFVKRASLPFVLVSLRMAEYKVAAGV